MRHVPLLLAVVVCIVTVFMTLHFRRVAKRAIYFEKEARTELESLQAAQERRRTELAEELEARKVKRRRRFAAVTSLDARAVMLDDELELILEHDRELQADNDRMARELDVLRKEIEVLRFTISQISKQMIEEKFTEER